MASSRLDIVIFGATGFTGKVAANCMFRMAKEKNVTWGVAGRNASKLKDLLSVISAKIGESLDNVAVIVADVNDKQSLTNMAAKAKVVINCVGPYRFYGEAVVRACIEEGTHHIDVSGEPQYMENMQITYNNSAEEMGVYVISACGFDSIPADLGLMQFIQEFKGEVNSVETYLELGNTKKVEGASLNYATWESAVHGLAHADELRPIRGKLFPEPLPKLAPKLQPRSTIHKSDVINKWSLPFPGADPSVMYRSQRYLYEHDKVRPVQVKCYIAFQSFFVTLVVAFMAVIFGIMTKTEFTRNLLLKYPKFFSGGATSSDEGPSEESMINSFMTITFSGEGWTERATLEEGHSGPPNKTLVAKLSATDVGYGLTSKAAILSAITILREADKIPGKGGVLPPGAAFAKTSLFKELTAHGVKFEVLEEKTC